ncbi:insulinase family protein, partial [Commensalibacter sp. B14384M3]|nr:insulinase family protein [Commensalibacter sp. B14384M3]
LQAMQTQPVSEHELQLAKASLLRSIPLQRSSIDKLASQYLTFSELGLPLDTPQRSAQIYYRMSAGDIRKAFKTWIRIDDLAQITKGPINQK